MNAYELAAARFEQISRHRQTIIDTAQAVIDWAEQEWTDAQANLARFESAPGIPLPEYRAAVLTREQ